MSIIERVSSGPCELYEQAQYTAIFGPGVTLHVHCGLFFSSSLSHAITKYTT